MFLTQQQMMLRNSETGHNEQETMLLIHKACYEAYPITAKGCDEPSGPRSHPSAWLSCHVSPDVSVMSSELVEQGCLQECWRSAPRLLTSTVSLTSGSNRDSLKSEVRLPRDERHFSSESVSALGCREVGFYCDS